MKAFNDMDADEKKGYSVQELNRIGEEIAKAMGEGYWFDISVQTIRGPAQSIYGEDWEERYIAALTMDHVAMGREAEIYTKMGLSPRDVYLQKKRDRLEGERQQKHDQAQMEKRIYGGLGVTADDVAKYGEVGRE